MGRRQGGEMRGVKRKIMEETRGQQVTNKKNIHRKQTKSRWISWTDSKTLPTEEV